MSFTGQLYQLEHTAVLSDGAYVAVNGPWDTYGYIVKKVRTEQGRHLYLIRGCKRRFASKPVAQF